jgi:hypothetical protein
VIEITLPVDGLECEVTVETTTVGDREVPSRILLKPLFRSAESSVSVLYIQASDSKGRMLNRKVLRQSGATGSLSLSDRTEYVQPGFERQDEPQPVKPTKETTNGK